MRIHDSVQQGVCWDIPLLQYSLPHNTSSQQHSMRQSLINRLGRVDRICGRADLPHELCVAGHTCLARRCITGSKSSIVRFPETCLERRKISRPPIALPKSAPQTRSHNINMKNAMPAVGTKAAMKASNERQERIGRRPTHWERW